MWKKIIKTTKKHINVERLTIVNTNPPTIGHGPDLREILQRRHNHLVWLVLQRLEDGGKELLNQLERPSAKRRRRAKNLLKMP